MKVLGFRFSITSPDAESFAKALETGLGLPTTHVGDNSFGGAIFPAGDSWVEVWPESAEMPAGTLLQIIVDDADAWAAQARSNGLDPMGPTDAHGERIYFLQLPGKLPVTFQSKLEQAE